MAKTIDTRRRIGRTRTLCGRRYRLHDVYKDHDEALQEAKRLRQRGYYAQIENRGKWVVWKRFRELVDIGTGDAEALRL